MRYFCDAVQCKMNKRNDRDDVPTRSQLLTDRQSSCIQTNFPEKMPRKIVRKLFSYRVCSCCACAVCARYNAHASFNRYRARSVYCLHTLSQTISYSRVRLRSIHFHSWYWQLFNSRVKRVMPFTPDQRHRSAHLQ